MKIHNRHYDKWQEKKWTARNIPNGGVGILNTYNQLIAYNKTSNRQHFDRPFSADWDFVNAHYNFRPRKSKKGG